MSLFKQLFLNNTPILDLRAPVEFAQGAFPNATNIPLLSDNERELIGTCYKQQGQDKAIELGHEIVSGVNKAKKIQAWKTYFKENPDAHLYCFRGGMRSHLVQEWLQAEGINVPLIKGGYKALRSYLIKVLEQPLDLIRISGQTGVGKTDLLVLLEHMIDLEGLANHRGSAFGKYVKKQPSQIDFENNLAIEILKRHQENKKAIIVEDEGRYIGSINLPMAFIESMKNSPVTILTCSTDDRLERIYQDYVVVQKSDYIDKNPKNGGELFDESLLQALEKIQKRLGGVRYKQLNQTMQSALQQESETLHKQWIADLLEYYYDPMYDYQLEKKSELVVFRGDKRAVGEYLEEAKNGH